MTMRRVLLLCAALTLATGPLLAHHSGAMFDRTRKVTLSGTVVKFEYVQPHSWIQLTLPNGKVYNTKPAAPLRPPQPVAPPVS